MPSSLSLPSFAICFPRMKASSFFANSTENYGLRMMMPIGAIKMSELERDFLEIFERI
jgi:hypothetical protein